MPDREYKLVYKGDNADILAKSQQVVQALMLLEQWATKAQAALKGAFKGQSTSINSANRALDKVNTTLQAMPGHANAAAAALKGLGSAAPALNKGLGGAADRMGDFVAAAAGLHVARQAFGAIMDASREIEERWQKMAEEATAFRDRLRELANLKGESGPNNKVYADVLRMALESGSTAEKAHEFAQSYENIGPTVREKGHYRPGPGQGTPEQLEHRILVATARTARRMQIDEAAAGEAIGTAGMFHTFRSPEEAMDQFGTALKGLSLGKVPYTGGVRALNKASAKLVDPSEAHDEGAKAGRVGSYGEAGVYMGALSLGTGTADQAAHRMVQISRVMNSYNDQGKRALADAGITDQMTDPQKLIRFGKYMKEQEVADPIAWMKEHGLGSDATREATAAGLKVADVLEQRLKDAEAASGERHGFAAGRGVIAENDLHYAKDKSATSASAASIRDVMDKVEGEGVEVLAQGRAFAEERMRLNDPTYRSVLRKPALAVTAPLAHILGGDSAEEYHQEYQMEFGAMPYLFREGKKHGVDVKKEFPGIESWDRQTRSRAYAAAVERVQGAGGDPMGRRELLSQARNRVEAIPGQGGPAGAAAAAGAAALPGGQDAEALRIQREQLNQLQAIRQNMQGGPAVRALPAGPAPLPGGPQRPGQ